MPTPTYVAIAKVVLSTNTSSVSFSSIPSTYTDLVVKISAKDTFTGQDSTWCYYTLNNVTSSYSNTRIVWTNGTTVASSRTSNATEWQVLRLNGSSAAVANIFGSAEIYIPNYNSSTNKISSNESVAEVNSTSGVDLGQIAAGLWSNTSAITSIQFSAAYGTWAANSRFDLYGIKSS